MAIADTLMSSSESVIDTVTDAFADAGELVLDAFGSSKREKGGRKLRRAILVLMLAGGVIGIALYKRSQARQAAEASGSSS
jgi:hypothetical protein